MWIHFNLDTILIYDETDDLPIEEIEVDDKKETKRISLPLAIIRRGYGQDSNQKNKAKELNISALSLYI